MLLHLLYLSPNLKLTHSNTMIILRRRLRILLTQHTLLSRTHLTLLIFLPAPQHYPFAQTRTGEVTRPLAVSKVHAPSFAIDFRPIGKFVRSLRERRNILRIVLKLLRGGVGEDGGITAVCCRAKGGVEEGPAVQVHRDVVVVDEEDGNGFVLRLQ